MDESAVVSLRVEAPICSFRKGWAREYLETEDIAPPATVFGFLLSLAGEEEREIWQGTRIAYGRIGKPERSTVLRTVWRVKDAKTPPGSGTNRRPDFQELLTGVQLGIWVYSPGLVPRLRNAFTGSQRERFGGLSLGESRDLVNDVSLDPRFSEQETIEWLVADREGDQPLPIWVDHIGSRGTVRGQFRLRHLPWECPSEGDPRWIEIRGPTAEESTPPAKKKRQKKASMKKDEFPEMEPSHDP